MWPWFRLIMSGSSSLTVTKWARVLTRQTFSMLEGSASMIRLKAAMPALLMRIEGAPRLERIESAAALTC